MSTTEQSQQGAAQDSATAVDEQVPRQRSVDLLQGGKRLIIEHRGEAYCLRLTRNEKLILTKL